ncbi:MAG: 3-deoxy-D-manno-octulosonic acid transferase [Paracoccaceae bacterium]
MLFYRVIMACLAPVFLGLTVLDRLRGRLPRGALAQRLGFVPKPGAGRTIWLHGASNGELTSARWVLERLLEANPDSQALVTANTGTAVQMVRGWGLAGITAALSPLDTLGAAGRVLRRWHPALLLIVENELWPARLTAAQAAGVPVALIGARMSEGSARRWQRFAPGLMRQGLSGLAHVSAQDAGSSARLKSLGVPQGIMGPDVMLKAHAITASTTPPDQPAARDRVLLAASTHPGEEAMILQAFQQARGQFDLLILAPRHPRRASEVAALITTMGLSFTSRSAGAMPKAGIPVFLADTMGEMALWYAMAGVTVIGGSFVPLDGHTPYEPAAHGSAIVHGPFMANFAEAVANLAEAGGAISVNRAGLGAELARLDATRQSALAEKARRVLVADQDAEALPKALLQLLQ